MELVEYYKQYPNREINSGIYKIVLDESKISDNLKVRFKKEFGDNCLWVGLSKDFKARLRKHRTFDYMGTGILYGLSKIYNDKIQKKSLNYIENLKKEYGKYYYITPRSPYYGYKDEFKYEFIDTWISIYRKEYGQYFKLLPLSDNRCYKEEVRWIKKLNPICNIYRGK